MRFHALMAAFIVYGVFGSPTPDRFTWVEMVMAVLLATACFPDFKTVMAWRQSGSTTILAMCFAVLVTVPGVVAILSGHTMHDMMRDVLPLVFFFLPLWLWRLAQQDPQRLQSRLIAALLVTGVAFAARFTVDLFFPFTLLMSGDPAIHLANAPSLLFAGLFLIVHATTLAPRRLIGRVVMMGLGILCFLPLVVTLQRGALLLAFGVLGWVAAGRARQSPVFAWMVTGVAMLAVAFCHPGMAAMLEVLWRKTREVGDNARFREIVTVMGAMQDAGDVVFGLGWGAKILTAASGFHEVRYTHMIASYFFFKAGIVGVAALGAVVSCVIKWLKAGFAREPLVALCLLPSLFLGFTVYTSFKMLDFGAMLGLLACLARQQDNVLRASPHTPLKSDSA